MNISPVVLEGERVRLEPLSLRHVEALSEVAFHPALWRHTTDRLTGIDDLLRYVNTALDLVEAKTLIAWVTRERRTEKVVGMTRFMDFSQQHRTLELGSTWVHPDYQRTGINVEAKYLQLEHAFERMSARRVGLKTHHENLQSQRAMRALGATQEGVFRNHMIMPDGTARHSVWFSIVAEEWPEVQARLRQRMRSPAHTAEDRRH